MSPIADDRLRLIFTCCHPALAMDARVALTLRTLGGLSTPEIARAFLVPEPTLAQRLVRAKRKIRDAGHPVPRPAGPRPAGAARRRPARPLPDLQRGLRRDIRRPARPARAVRGGDPAGAGPRLADARRAGGARAARADAPPRRAARGADGPGGELVLLEDQDRGRWDRAKDRRGPGAARPGAADAAGRAEPAPGGDRGAPRRRGHGRRDGLGPDRGAVRGARPGGAVAGRRAEPGGRGRDGVGPGARPPARRRASPPPASSRSTRTSTPRGPISCAGSAGCPRPPTPTRGPAS